MKTAPRPRGANGAGDLRQDRHANTITDDWFQPVERAEFARAMVFEVFGRHARALDYGDFTDRAPHDPRRQAPTAWRWSQSL